MSGAGDNLSRKKDAEDCKNKGNEFLAKKDYEKAVEWYKQAITLDPTNHVYYSNRSAAYLSMNYKDAALKDAKECVRLNPNWSKGYSRIGAAYHAMGKYEDAIKAYDDGLKIEPNNSSLIQGKEEVLSAMRGPDPSSQPDFNNLAEQLMRNPAIMNYFATHPDKLATLQSNPMAALQDPELMTILQSALSGSMGGGMGGMGGGMGGMGGMGGAGGAPHYPPPPQSNSYNDIPPSSSKVEEVNDDTPPPSPPKKTKKEVKQPEVPLTPEKQKATDIKNKGNDLYKNKQFEEAIKLYKEAQLIDNTDIIYTINIAACHVELGKLDEAINICEEAITKGREIKAPFDSIAKAYARIGNCYFKLKNYSKAIEYYENSLLENNIQSVKGQLTEAKRLYELQKKTEYEDPDKAKEHKDKGNQLMKDGNVPEAIKEYDEAIKRNPKDAILYSNRAAAYSKLMDYGRALADAEKAISIDPNYVKAWGRKGLIEYSLKRYHKALDAYQKGLELDPNNQECISGLEATNQKIQEGIYKFDPERKARAEADPEIQNILIDPAVQQALKDMNDPKSRDAVMKNPGIQEKINRLIAAGMICMGPQPGHNQE